MTVSSNSKSPITTLLAKGVISAAMSIKAQEGTMASAEQVTATKEFLYLDQSWSLTNALKSCSFKIISSNSQSLISNNTLFPSG